MNCRVFVADYGNKRHAADIIQLLDIYALDPMGGGACLPEEVKRDLVPELAKRPWAFSVLAHVDDEAAGLINCFEGFSTFAARPLVNIHDVIVAPRWRGMGISRRMLETVQAVAVERGCCKLTLELLEGNASAREAYARFGFQPYSLDERMGHAVFWHKKL